MLGSNISVDALWNTLGWTMIHFVWLGAIVALVAAAARFALRNGPVTMRYMVTLIGFLAMAVLPIAIAAWLMMNSAVAPGFAGGPAVATEEILSTPSAPGSAGGLPANDLLNTPTVPTFAGGFSGDVPLGPRQSRGLLDIAWYSTLENCAQFLPWLWCIGTPLTFLFLATGLLGAERLRLSGKPLGSGPIFDACQRIRESLGIGRHVAVAVCDRVAVPVLVGIVRPLVLLPSIAVGGWSPEQIEMVLVHELAHVRRWDNLVNLIQRIVESLLFFHPAVWLMSSWLRRDREECCDAVVVGHTREPRVYAETLLAIAAQAAGAPFPMTGVALTGQARRLADRIRAILGQPNDPMLVSRRTLAAALVVLLCSVALPLSYFPRDSRAEETDAATEVVTNADAATDSDAAASSDHDAASDADERLGLEADYMLTFTEATDGELRLGIHPKSEKPSPFLSLEDQKRADLAWKRLGWELEPTTKGQRNRIQSVGYDGGLMITRDVRRPPFQDDDPRDLLVGLHVWPIKSLKDVADVLNRNDLADLSPLKFHIVRPVDKGEYGLIDVVVTGRIEVNLPSAFQNRFDLFPAEGQNTGRIRLRAVPPSTEAASDDPDWIEIDPAVSPRELFGAGSVTLDRDGRVQLQITQQRDAIKRQLEEQLSMLNRQLETVADQAHRAKLFKAMSEVQKALHEIAVAESEVDAAVKQLQDPSSAEPAAQREKDEALRQQQLQKDAGGRGRQLLYDGKTFAEWRDLWQNELSASKRAEAVKALAAFGANGYGKEAAQAILSVVRLLDWTTIESEKSDAGKLKAVCIEVFVGGESTGGYRIPTAEWLPQLIDLMNGGDGAAKTFAGHVFPRLSPSNSAALEPLLNLSRESDLELTALHGLKAIDPRLQDERVLARVRDALSSADSGKKKITTMQLLVFQDYSQSSNPLRWPTLQYVPELMTLLFDAEPGVRRQARWELSCIRQEDAPTVVEQLMGIINDEDRTADRIEAIRALAAMGLHAEPAESVLTEIVKSEEGESRVAAGFALLRARELEVHQADLRLITILGGETTARGPKFPDDRTEGVYNELVKTLDKEQEEIFPPKQFRGGHGGGGGGGFF